MMSKLPYHCEVDVLGWVGRQVEEAPGLKMGEMAVKSSNQHNKPIKNPPLAPFCSFLSTRAGDEDAPR